MLQASHLTYRIGGRRLLTDVTFTAQAGEVLAIVGPNGAGKSTLLRLLAGEQTPTSGSVTVRGESIRHVPGGELARFRGVLHQQNPLSFPFRVDELVLMGRYPHCGTAPTPTDYALAGAALATVGMTAFADRSVTTLSGGEQQRVQLARVLAQLSDVTDGLLLLDEPTTGLDLRHQHQTLAVAGRMAERGHTVVAVLHDLNLAAQYADRILMLQNGRLVAIDRPRAVLTAPLIERVFDLPVQLLDHPDHPFPLVVSLPLLWNVVSP